MSQYYASARNSYYGNSLGAASTFSVYPVRRRLERKSADEGSEWKQRRSVEHATLSLFPQDKRLLDEERDEEVFVSRLSSLLAGKSSSKKKKAGGGAVDTHFARVFVWELHDICALAVDSPVGSLQAFSQLAELIATQVFRLESRQASYSSSFEMSHRTATNVISMMRRGTSHRRQTRPPR